jgi:hypothetical protein
MIVLSIKWRKICVFSTLFAAPMSFKSAALMNRTTPVTPSAVDASMLVTTCFSWVHITGAPYSTGSFPCTICGDVTTRKRHSFLNFSYVCPGPVVVE